MKSKFHRLLIAALASTLPSVLAACSSSTSYTVIPNFVEPGACIPGGYFQAQDLGNTNPSDLTAQCEAQCTRYGSQCSAFVGQLFKAADSNLYSGQCFFYATSPTGPQRCVDHPTVIIAEQKDTLATCFSSSSIAATAFCSSYLSIGTVTSYTSTITPVQSVTSTITTTTQTTSTTLKTTTTSSTTISTATERSIATSTTISTVTSISTSVTVTSTTLSQTLAARDASGKPFSVEFVPSISRTTIVRRLLPSPTPACVPAFESAASISSACSCLSITSTTVLTVLTAPTKTTTIKLNNTKVNTLVSTTSTTSIFIKSSTATITTTVTTVTPTTTTTTQTSLSTSVLVKTCGIPGSHCTLSNFVAVCCSNPDGSVGCNFPGGDPQNGVCYLP